MKTTVTTNAAINNAVKEEVTMNTQFANAFAVAANSVKEENTMNIETIIAAAAIYCEGVIAHVEVIAGKLMMGCRGCYEKGEIVVVSPNGKVELVHPFSDDEDIDITQGFWEIVDDLERVQKMNSAQAIYELAELEDYLGYIYFIGVDDAHKEVMACLLFERLYPIYGDELFELIHECEGHGEDSHVYIGDEDDIRIIVDQFLGIDQELDAFEHYYYMA